MCSFCIDIDWQQQGRIISDDFFSQFLEVSACLPRSQLLGETLWSKSEYCIKGAAVVVSSDPIVHYWLQQLRWWYLITSAPYPMCHFFKVLSMNLRLGTTCTILAALTKWRSLSQVEILRINFWQEIPIVILWKCTNCGVRRLNRGIKRLLFEGQKHKSSRLSISPDIKLLKVKFFTGQVRPALGSGGRLVGQSAGCDGCNAILWPSNHDAK